MLRLEIIGDEIWFGDYLVAEIVVKENNSIRVGFIELLESIGDEEYCSDDD